MIKKALISSDLKRLLLEKNTALDRMDVAVFTAATTDELLAVHRREKALLIVAQLETPGMRCEQFVREIRAHAGLRRVSVIIICKDTLDHRERARRCGANAIFTIPVDVALLNMKMQQLLLTIAQRKPYQMALAVAIQDGFKDTPRPFRTENVSASGMLMSAEEPLAKGDGIFFSFFLPDGSHASGYGEIARVVSLAQPPASFLYGIRFTDISPLVRQAIDAFVEKP